MLLAPARQIHRVARLFEALAAGTLTRAQLRRGIAADWGDFRQDAEEVGRGLFTWEDEALTRVLFPGARVLLVGCGTGRELLVLGSRGYRVTGVDPALPAVTAARAFASQHRLDATIVHGFFEDADLPGPFDAVVFTHRVYGMIQGSEFRMSALRKARLLLSERGSVVISFLTGQGMRAPLRFAANLASALGRRELRVEPGDELYPIGASPWFAFEHHFRPEAFRDEVSRAGFGVTEMSDGPCPTAILAPLVSTVSSVAPANATASMAVGGAP